jgi:hypothetical protein
MSYVQSRSARIFVVDSEAEMFALSALPGDMCRREDVKRNYILSNLPTDRLANWSLVSVYSMDYAVEIPLAAWELYGTDMYAARIEHGLGTRLVQPTVYEKAGGKVLSYEVNVVDENAIQVLTPRNPDGRLVLIIALVAVVL